MRTSLSKIFFFFWLSLLFSLSSLPQSENKESLFPHMDKLLHLTFFAIGTFLFQFGWKNLKPRTCFLLLFLIGISNEFFQSFIPTRQGNDFGDILANSLGILLSLLLYRKLFKGEGS